MKVHHLNCATLCPRGGRLINGTRSLFSPARLVCHCLLIETQAGLILVDTGLGLQDLNDPAKRLGRQFTVLTRPRLDVSNTAIRQIERLGFTADDVRHIVLTHLDLDHAGGLPDFPKAKVHVFEPEHRAAMARATLTERNRYRTVHWAHDPKWARHTLAGERWFDFECVRQLEGIPPEVLLVPLLGHTRGHCAIAVQTDQAWLLHAGDAYFYAGEMDLVRPHCTMGLRLFQRIVHMDHKLTLQNLQRLRDLTRNHSNEVAVFCAHDPTEFDRLLRPEK